MFKSCNSGGIRIAYQDRGNGEPLLLLMGLGASGLKWEPHIEEYEKRFRVLAVDNRGSGRSDKPVAETYSIREMAEDAIAVLDAENIEKAHVNGISMGGAIAQYLAIHYPQRVKSLILTNTFPRCNVSFRRSIEFLRDSIEQLDGRTFGHILQWIIYSSAFQDSNEEFILNAEANDADAANPMPAYAFKAQCNGILGFNVISELEKIEVPALIVGGDSDLFVPVNITREMADGIKGSTLFMCPNGGHVQHWEQLEQYNRITSEFLLEHCGK